MHRNISQAKNIFSFRFYFVLSPQGQVQVHASATISLISDEVGMFDYFHGFGLWKKMMLEKLRRKLTFKITNTKFELSWIECVP